MTRPKIHIILGFLILLVSLPACSASPAEPSIDLRPCQIAGRSAECGKLRVYENRAAKKGRMIDLNVAVIRAANPQKASDAVFLLSGGPGVAATQDTGNIELVSLMRDRDLVLVDQRGTGGSNMVVPPQTPDWSGLSPEEVEKAYAAWIKRVLPTLKADPRFYTTSVAMDDLDDVRQALGYNKIDLIGGSYGTTAAQYYLRQHENHVRSLVLISGSVGNVPIWERQAGNAQKALDAIFSLCEGESDCRSAYPNVRSEFSGLMARLKSKPVVVAVGNGTVNLTSNLFAAKVEDMLRDSQSAADLPRLVHKAYAENDWTAWGIASYGDWDNSIMSYSIQCNEAWADFLPEQTLLLGQGSFLLGWNLFRANKFSLLCKYLPLGVNPEGNNQPTVSQIPVLLFNGELDPIDPPANVALAKDIWPNSLSLVLPGQGHSISDPLTAGCLAQITRHFIIDASVKNLSTACLQDVHSSYFATYP